MVRKVNNGSNGEGARRMRERAEARRLEILRAAARAFRRQGFASTGMRDIAAEAKLSPGNLYHYFEGKHAILFFCQDRALDRMLEALEAARLSRRPRPEQLRAVILAHLHCLLDEIEGSTAHLEVEALPDELRRVVVDKRDRYERGIRRLVAAGVRAGELAPCDPELVTRAVLGAINWTARWFRPEGRRSSTVVAEALADYLMRGLLPAEADPPGVQAHDSGGTA